VTVPLRERKLFFQRLRQILDGAHHAGYVKSPSVFMAGEEAWDEQEHELKA